MSSTMTMLPAQTPSLERIFDFYSISEEASETPETTELEAAARASIVGSVAISSTYQMYPGLQTTMAADRTRSTERMPPTLNRPRKLSGSSEYSLPSTPSSGTASTRGRSPSWGSGISHDSVGPLTWKPAYMQTQKPAPLKLQKSRTRTTDLCASLPGEVLEVILEMLQQLHLAPKSESCATCWMRDACSIALCSRKWSKAAQLILYRDIQLLGPDSAGHKKKLKLTQGCRLTLLRRTLRANADIAAMVRTLKVPVPEMMLGVSNSKASAALEQYQNNVAALIMACPNLERLLGPSFSHDHSFSKLFYALTTRKNLKEMNWLLGPHGSTTQPATTSSQKDNALSTKIELQSQEEIAFLEHHRGWTKLTNLSVQCLPDATLAPDTLLARTLTVLPSLQHLHLCNLPSYAFNNSNLLSLPPLQSLTLSNIRGITSSGLSSFATNANSQPLRQLVLRHTPLTSLPALARIFSNLRSLSSFSLVQSFPPLMPESDSFILWMMPYLASASVKKLHWDITSHPNSINAADDLLARSIEAGGFPSLTTLRTPNDPEGVFQQLCRPMERIDLPSDRFHSSNFSEIGGSAPSSPKRPLAKSSTSSSLSLAPVTSHSDLVSARLAAQARLNRARDAHLFRVNVIDEGGDLTETFSMAGYMGTVGSNIDYYLHADEGSTDAKGGLVDIPDLHAHSTEDLSSGIEGCNGSWNWREGVVADKKEKERWWHTERGRWRRFELN